MLNTIDFMFKHISIFVKKIIRVYYTNFISKKLPFIFTYFTHKPLQIFYSYYILQYFFIAYYITWHVPRVTLIIRKCIFDIKWKSYTLYKFYNKMKNKIII